MVLMMGNKEARVRLGTLSINKREIVTKFLNRHNLKINQDNLDKLRGTNLGFELNQLLKKKYEVSETKEVELLPCPNCGSKPKIGSLNKDEENWAIWCETCKDLNVHVGRDGDTKEEILEAWNCLKERTNDKANQGCS